MKIAGLLLVVGLGCFSSLAYCDQTIGDWAVGTASDGESLYAGTINDSGNVFGQYCTPSLGGCFWLIGLSTACQTSGQYPVLANAESSATVLTITCSGQLSNGKYRYVFSDFDRVQQLLANSSRIGFAIPLQGDQFVVVRFSLKGSLNAVSVMRQAVAALGKAAPSRQQNTTDQRL